MDFRDLLATGATVAGIYGALNPDSKIGQFLGSGSRRQPVGYTGGIPEYQIERSLLPDAFATTTPTGEPRRPGSGGRRYFTDTSFTPTGEVMSPALAPTGNSSQGIYNALPQEAVVGLLRSMFGAGGVGGTTGGVGGVGGTTGGVGGVGGTKPPATKYTDAQVAETVSALASQYPDNQELYRQIGQRIADSGVPIEDAAQQLSRIVRIDGQTVTPQEIIDTYRSFGFAADGAGGTKPPATKYTDAQVAETISALASQYPDNQELYRQIGQRIADSGVPIEDAAQQLSRIVRIDGQTVTPQEIIDTYRSFGFAAGGLASLPQARGYYLGGSTDGMADRIPATINGRQPAALSDGEFVIPADVVSHLGNGNSDAGAQTLYSMMDRVRQARTGRKEQGRKIDPNKFTPA